MRCSSLLALLVALPAAAQGPALDARLAPDGLRVAFRAMDGATSRLFLRAVSDSGTGDALALGMTAVETYAWSPDGRAIVAGGRDGHLYLVRPDGSPARDLTPTLAGHARLAGFVEDGSAVMVMVPGRWPGAPDLARIELATGTVTRVATNDGGITDWITDAAGTPRAAVRAGEANAVELVRVRGDTVTPMYACDPGEVCEPLGVTPDRRLWVRSSRGRAAPALVIVDPITLDETVVRADLTGDPHAVFRDDSLFRHDRARLTDLLGAAPLAFASPTPDGARMLVTAPGPDGRVLYLFDRWTGTLSRLMALADDTAAQVTAAGPAPDPAQLAPARLRYRITENDPEMPSVELRRDIEHRSENGRSVWRVTDRATVPVYEDLVLDTAQLAEDAGMEVDFGPPPAPVGTTEATDVTILDGATLRPITRRAEGPRAVDLDFQAARVTGETVGGGFATDVDVPLEAPVWGDGAALALLVAALPLADGYETRVPVFDSEVLEPVTLRIAVSGSTAGAFRVTIRPVDGVGPEQEWNVRRAAPHLLLRAEYRSGAFLRTTELIDERGGS